MKGLKVTLSHFVRLSGWGAHTGEMPPLQQAGLRRKDGKTWPHFLTREKVDTDQMEVHSFFSIVCARRTTKRKSRL